MYWNNLIVEARTNPNPDPIVTSRHQGNHCLFYDPAVPVNKIVRLTLLQEICDVVNQRMDEDSYKFAREKRNSYEAANILRINQYVHSLKAEGSIKPMLIYYIGISIYDAATGGTRLMAAELIPELTHVSAFIDTRAEYRDQFSHLREIKNFDDFRECCGAVDGTQFWFRNTAPDADFGLDWYEVALPVKSAVVPGDNYCLQAVDNYLRHQPQEFRFEPAWFAQEIDWDHWHNI